MPAIAADRAHVLAMALTIACDIHPLNNLRVLKYLKGRLGQSQDEIDDWYRHWVGEGLPRSRRWPRPRAGAFLFGDAPTLADICLVPQLYNARRFAVPLDRLSDLAPRRRERQRARRPSPPPTPIARSKPHEPRRRHQPRHGRHDSRSNRSRSRRSKGKVSDEEWAIRVDLAAAYRLVAHYGWDDLIFTHLSARIPGPEHHFLLNPYNLMFEEVTASLAGQGRRPRQSGRADAVHHQPGRLHHPFGDPHGARGCAGGDAPPHAGRPGGAARMTRGCCR